MKTGKRKCIHGTCPTYAYFGERGGPALYCGQHKQPGTVDLKHKTCIFEGCQTRANFGNGNAGESPKYCAKHKNGVMRDMKHRRCEWDGEDGCQIRPSFGLPDDKEGPRFCAAHKDGDKHIDLVSKRCESQGCMTAASFGFIGGKRRFCNAHKLENMVGLHSKRKRTIETKPGTRLIKPKHDPSQSISEQHVLLQSTSAQSSLSDNAGLQPMPLSSIQQIPHFAAQDTFGDLPQQQAVTIFPPTSAHTLIHASTRTPADQQLSSPALRQVTLPTPEHTYVPASHHYVPLHALQHAPPAMRLQQLQMGSLPHQQQYFNLALSRHLHEQKLILQAQSRTDSSQQQTHAIHVSLPSPSHMEDSQHYQLSDYEHQPPSNMIESERV